MTGKYLKGFFLLTLVVLACISIASASDVVDDTNSDIIETTTVASEQVETNTVDNIPASDNTEKTITNKNIKQNTQGNYTINNEQDFDELFISPNSNNTYYLNVSNGSNITFNTNISKSNGSYIINKTVNILGNNYTLDLNTISGYNLNISNPTYIEFNNNSSNSNISYLKFHNTQIYTTTASNILFDHINVTVENQGVGKGVGVFSMRKGVINVTVKNSYFHVVNNTGCSSIVITSGENCTIDNNTVIGEGNVGNLIYLNRWGAVANANGITQNKGNKITNNRITGPETPLDICIAICIGGPNNEIINNTVNYTGKGINNDWAGTYNATSNTTNDYYNITYNGNAFINNTLNNGATFTASQRSFVAGNYITGTANITQNSTVINNTFKSTVKIKGYTNFTKNVVESTLYVTGNYNNVTNNTIDEVNISGNYSNVTNNRLYSYIIDTGSNNIISPNTYIDNDLALPIPNKTLKRDDEPSILEITNDNLETYGKTRPSGYQFSGSKIRPYDIICFTEDMANKTIILGVNDEKKIFTAKPGVVFTNSWFYLAGGMNKVLENITFDLNILDSEGHTFFLVNGENNTFRNLKITYEEPSTSPSYLIKVQNRPNFVMDNCTVESTVIADLVDWGHNTDHPDLPSVIPFYIVGDNCTVMNNNLSTEAYHTTSGDYQTLYNMYINGINNVISNNTISVNGQRWMYNVILGSSSNNNIIKDNNINTKSINYSAGIYLTGTNIHDNLIEGNILNTTAGYDKERDEAIGSPEFVSYGVVVENRAYMGGNHYYGEGNMVKNDIINNTFLGSAYNIYGLEIFGADGSTVENNTVNLSGNTTMGLGAIGCNTTFNNNTITLDGEREYGSTVDYLGAGTTGVLILRSDDSAAINNKVTSTFYGVSVFLSTNSLVDGNNITSSFNYTINTNGANNSNITNNYLIAKELKGDASVKDFNSTGTLIENNLPKEVKEYSLVMDTTEFTVGQTTTISASVYYGEDLVTDLSKGKVSFKVNGKTLKDENGKVIYAKLVNGTASIEDFTVPESWAKEGSTIQAVYSGSSDVAKMSSEKTEITIPQELTITTEDITTTVGGTVTLTATINTPATINTGKVVFKINGKTLKDENGKVIYTKVSNNQVTLEYTLPDTYKAGTYTLTAVFISPNYERIEDTKTLTVN